GWALRSRRRARRRASTRTGRGRRRWSLLQGSGPLTRRIKEQLAPGPALGEVDLRLRRLAERIGPADHDAQLSAPRAREEVGERRVDHRRAVEAVPQPEAHDRLAAAHQPAGLDLVLLARGDAV